MINIGNVMILGDSYSTFEGYVPKGYDTWYDPADEQKAARTDVTRVEQTWWHILLQETISHLVRNDSWSGSPVCNTGYDGADVSEWSFIARFDRLVKEDFFTKEKVDTLFIFGGTNDSSANSPVGELQYSNWTKENLYCALPAFSYLLSRVKEILPDTRVIWLLNTELKDEIADGILAACQHHNVEYICLRDIDKQVGHPSILGMKAIKEQVLAYLDSKVV